MSFFKKLFGPGKKEDPAPAAAEQPLWIEASNNKWGIPLLDLRPVTQTMTSTSKDAQMARNAASFGGEDGTCFWGLAPGDNKIIDANVTVPIDGVLYPGVLYNPLLMENKWAIYFDGSDLIFVRSWQRKVYATAKTSQKNDQLFIESITGNFAGEDDEKFTLAVLNFLLLSHALGEIVPAPLPAVLASDLHQAAIWAFSIYGNMAHIGTFDENILPGTVQPLRTHSLLHIAVAKSDVAGIEAQLKNGISVNALAGDGLGALQWAIANQTLHTMQVLLAAGANPDLRSGEGATALMNAVQSNRIDQLNLLLQAGASVNAKDNRGFTALHRAAEMGHLEIAKMLLQRGADKTIEAESHTALSLATVRENQEMIELLKD